MSALGLFITFIPAYLTGVLQLGCTHWHNRAVQSFSELLPKGTYAGLFNPAGRNTNGLPLPDRAIPDVSAQADLLRIFLKVGERLNGEGFWERFNDITSGDTPGCSTPGFNATAGWNPVTGFGTPNFGKLRRTKAFMSITYRCTILGQLPADICAPTGSVGK
ncbi:hypothetical protein EDB86DRAFT_3240043 [Lactarius hatsudake]|nr:hypothetical protein EDB86DRAFT_3240043 [Lactarius hatsudake]